ncbi:MAG: hypothetical protein ABWY00_00845 [Dongiaceae bacterium]
MRRIYFALATAAFGTAGLLSAAIADGMTTSAGRPTADSVIESADQLHYVDVDATPSPTISAAAPRSIDGAAYGAALADAPGRDPREAATSLEYRPTEHWSTQLQYTYMSVGGGNDAVAACCSADDNWKIDRQILAVQFGVSYHYK